jgi:hypothetical protein
MTFVGILVTLFLGLVSWRIQLIGKRRTEIAEEALLAFAKAIDALSSIRAPMSFAGEHKEMRKELGEPEDVEMPGETYRIILWRLHKHSASFVELRRLQLLCKYHFGERAKASFDKIFEARRKVQVAASMGSISVGEQLSPEGMKRRQEWHAAMWAGAEEPDKITEAVNAAQGDLEELLTPHLRADAAILPIAIAWRGGKARAEAFVARIRGRQD